MCTLWLIINACILYYMNTVWDHLALLVSNGAPWETIYIFSLWKRATPEGLNLLGEHAPGSHRKEGVWPHCSTFHSCSISWKLVINFSRHATVQVTHKINWLLEWIQQLQSWPTHTTNIIMALPQHCHCKHRSYQLHQCNSKECYQ